MKDRFSQPLTYENGFSFDRPTPDTSFHPQNQVALLNRQNGSINFNINHSIAFSPPYQLHLRVDSWRKGSKIASVYKQFPLRTVFCDSLINPITFPTIYNPSIINQQRSDTVKVLVGQSINYPLEVRADSATSKLFLQATSAQFAVDYTSISNCLKPPCAVLINQSPSYDSTAERYLVQGVGTLNTTLNWQTDTVHLENDSCSILSFFF